MMEEGFLRFRVYGFKVFTAMVGGGVLRLHKGSKALHTAFSVEGFRFTGFRVFGGVWGV